MATDDVPARRRRALLIASATYVDPGLAALRAPTGDVEALADVLGDEAIGGFEVERLVDESTDTIKKRIEHFFRESRRQDLLLFYFSGHGVLAQDRRFYFATASTELEWVRTTAIDDRFVNEAMDQSRARSIVVLLDCCHSGAFGKGLVPKSTLTAGVEHRFDGHGRVTLTASDELEYAFEETDPASINELGAAEPGSLFTRCLVEGLRSGEADTDRDGAISVDDLYDYVKQQVRDRSAHQSPRMSGSVSGDIVIARSARRAALPADLEAAAQSSLAGVREGAVGELASLTATAGPELAAVAREALERLADDDSRRVSEAAQAVLAGGAPPAAAPKATPGRRHRPRRRRRRRPRRRRRRRPRPRRRPAPPRASRPRPRRPGRRGGRFLAGRAWPSSPLPRHSWPSSSRWSCSRARTTTTAAAARWPPRRTRTTSAPTTVRRSSSARREARRPTGPRARGRSSSIRAPATTCPPWPSAPPPPACLPRADATATARRWPAVTSTTTATRTSRSGCRGGAWSPSSTTPPAPGSPRAGRRSPRARSRTRLRCGEFGAALAAGDVDGDDVADLVVGSPGTKDERAASAAGAVYVFRGSSDDGLSAADVKALEPPDGSQPAFGSHLALGDVNGDDDLDVIEGARDEPDFDFSGHLSRCLGQDGGPTECEEVPGSDGFGTSALAVADLDGDGFDEVLQGDEAPFDGADYLRGVVRIWGGAEADPPTEPLEISLATPGVPRSGGPGDTFGHAVDAGDLDGDRLADMVVGAPEDGAGSVTIVRGTRTVATRADSYSLPRPDDFGGFGEAVAILDVDGDRHLDVVAASSGGRQLDDVLFVYKGTATGIVPQAQPTALAGMDDDLAVVEDSPLVLGR